MLIIDAFIAFFCCVGIVATIYVALISYNNFKIRAFLIKLLFKNAQVYQLDGDVYDRGKDNN